MGVFTDRVRLLSSGKRKAFFSRIHAAEQQESSPAVREWLSELHHYIRKTSSSALESFQYAGKIGEGEYGEVHLMRDNAGKEYALKMMEATEQDCQYIIAEALLWKRVDSCTVARLYDAFCIGPLCFFLLELGGITLDVWLQKKLRKSSAETILSHMMVLLCSLDALHNCAGIIHGDLKPDNVVRCATSMLKLIDFGCAAEIDPRGQQQVGPEGSMAFMAPEKMFEGRDGTAADIYAMGGILYQLVYGYDCFPYCPAERFTQSYSSHEEAVADWQDSLASTEFITPSVAYLPNSTMPAVLELLRGMLAKDAAQRWTLEQCVASPAFSDELLLKLRKACPELAPHLEHFMDLRAAAHPSRLSLSLHPDGTSSCDDTLSVDQRALSSASLNSTHSAYSTASYASSKVASAAGSVQYKSPGSIQTINIRPAYRLSASTGCLTDLEAQHAQQQQQGARPHMVPLHAMGSVGSIMSATSLDSAFGKAMMCEERAEEAGSGSMSPRSKAHMLAFFNCFTAQQQQQAGQGSEQQGVLRLTQRPIKRLRHVCKLLWRVLRFKPSKEASAAQQQQQAQQGTQRSLQAKSVPTVLIGKCFTPGVGETVDFKIMTAPVAAV